MRFARLTLAALLLAGLASLPAAARGTAIALRATTTSVGSPKDKYASTVLVAPIDLNQDGRLDLATISSRPDVYPHTGDVDALTTLTNRGGGRFTFRATKPLGRAAVINTLEAADVDGDHVPDLLYADAGTNRMGAFWLSRGGPTTRSAIGGLGARIGGVADFNGDGKADVAAGNTDGVVIMLGNGDGTFRRGTAYPEPGQGSYAATPDVNGDGRADLAVSQPFGEGIEILLGRGNGTFGEPTLYPTDATPLVVVARDLNGDGKVDLATPTNDGNTVSVLVNNGDGTFAPRRDFPTGDGPLDLAAADLNGDGHVDLATPDQYGRDITVLLGDGHGAFSPGATIPTAKEPIAVAAADFDGNGSADLAATVSREHYDEPGDVVLFRRGGPGTVPRCVVPSVRGKRLAVAKKLIAAAGCGVGVPQFENSRRRFKGRVMTQSPRARLVRPVDTSVALHVGRGGWR